MALYEKLAKLHTKIDCCMLPFTSMLTTRKLRVGVLKELMFTLESAIAEIKKILEEIENGKN